MTLSTANYRSLASGVRSRSVSGLRLEPYLLAGIWEEPGNAIELKILGAVVALTPLYFLGQSCPWVPQEASH